MQERERETLWSGGRAGVWGGQRERERERRGGKEGVGEGWRRRESCWPLILREPRSERRITFYWGQKFCAVC